MRPVDRFREAAHAANVLTRSGVLHPERPGRVLRMARAYRHWGAGLAAPFALAAARYETRAVIEDDERSVSFAELDGRTDAIAFGLSERGVRAGSNVGVLCRNHLAFFDALGAIAKLGGNALLLNTGFSGPQLREVMQREHAIALIHDDDFTAIADGSGVDARLPATSLDDIVARHTSRGAPVKPAREGRTIILTSGTTGAPKGAVQNGTADPVSGVAILDRLPYRARETMIVAAPCFHAWGLTNSIVALLLGNTMVLEPRFDPERVLAAIELHQANVLVVVPVMLSRILDLPAATRSRYDTSSLRFVPLSGSALPGDLAPRFMDAFGDVVYNLYGSTEVGVVSIAGPDDLRAAPATAGRAPRGTEMRLLDEHDRVVTDAGETGRIFVRSPLVFDGYTDGNSKPVVDGFMQTGDTGHVDAAGRLFVDGRDDDMIISGGENVFPGEVEDVVARHPDVVEVAVTGVPDAEFGQRLKAFVVRRPGTELDADAVRAYVRATLANYKVPRDVEFVSELPRNATGKVVRRALD